LVLVDEEEILPCFKEGWEGYVYLEVQSRKGEESKGEVQFNVEWWVVAVRTRTKFIVHVE